MTAQKNTVKPRIGMRKYRHLKYVLYALPVLFAWFMVAIYPHLEVIPMSLFKWGPISDKKEFVGFYYYKILFTLQWDRTKGFLINTLLYVLFLFLIQTVLSMALAMALQKDTRHNRVFRTLFFLPKVLSSTMVGLTWSYMIDPNLGILNNLLAALQIPGFPGHSFLSTETGAILLVVIVHIWANIGYPITIITSGLQTISTDVYEAAKIDGASRIVTFFKVTLPLLLPTLLRLTLLTVTTGAMSFDYLLMIGDRAETKAFDTLSAVIYKGIVGDTNYGFESARSVLLFGILLIVCIAQFVATKKAEEAIYG